MDYEEAPAPAMAKEYQELRAKLRRPVKLTQSSFADPFEEMPKFSERDALAMFADRFEFPQLISDELIEISKFRVKPRMPATRISSRLNTIVNALINSDSFAEDFFEIGKAKYRTVYIPIFQVLCVGQAGSRFQTFIEFSSSNRSNLGIHLKLKGAGLSGTSSGSFGVSFAHEGGLNGTFQLSLPAILETKKYRHRKNNDITGIKSEFIEIDAEASVITPSEVDYVEVTELDYKPKRRFGATKTLERLSYSFERSDTLEGKVSLGLHGEIGTFSLNAMVTDKKELAVRFEAKKKGVFSREVAQKGPLAHRFDARELEF